jgi:glycosyltransferase involved in cell wall biosynthesis
MAAEIHEVATSSHTDSAAARRAEARPRIAYLISRFPKLTETFVLDEILEMERAGIVIEVFPLWRERTDVIHPEARPIVARAHFTPTLDLPILRDNLCMLWQAPGLYLATLAILLKSNARSPRFLIAALAIFPKACHFARRMQDLGVEHVHAHFASHPAAAAWIVGRFSKIPFSFTAHGSDLHREQAMLEEKVAAARFVVTISEYNRQFILDRIGPRYAEKLLVIHCGVDPKRFERTRTRADVFEVGCIGTLHAVKGQGVLLEACTELEKRAIPFRCHLVGDGPDRSDLETRATRLGIIDHVVFHGRCERERVRELLGEWDVLVAPSVPTKDGRREGIPVVLMEAAAAGLPLVASRLSGIPEIVHHDETGLLTEPGNATELADALVRLALEPRTGERLAAAARARVDESFRLDRNAAELRRAFFEGIRA